MIVRYPYGTEEIVKWVAKLTSLYPDVDEVVYRKIVDNYILGVSKFDANIGLLNITLKIRDYI